MERDQLRRKAFVDRHTQLDRATLREGSPVLVFTTRSGLMPDKLKLRRSGPYWLLKEHAEAFQLGTLDGQILPAWVNGFRLHPYYARCPQSRSLTRRGLYDRRLTYFL